MSYTQIIAFDINGDAIHDQEFPNSHFHGPVIWDYLWKKYRSSEDKNGWVKGDERLWGLQYDSRLSDDEWYVFMCTFDNIVVLPLLFDKVCDSFIEFGKKLDSNTINHSEGYVNAIRKLMKDIPGIRGIAWYQTSVIDDPWICYDGDDLVPYNLNNDNTSFHYFMKPRKVWIQGKENKTSSDM